MQHRAAKVWPESLQDARRRFALRFLQYLQRGAVAKLLCLQLHGTSHQAELKIRTYLENMPPRARHPAKRTILLAAGFAGLQSKPEEVVRQHSRIFNWLKDISARRNFLIVTHGDCIGSVMSIMPDRLHAIGESAANSHKWSFANISRTVASQRGAAGSAGRKGRQSILQVTASFFLLSQVDYGATILASRQPVQRMPAPTPKQSAPRALWLALMTLYD